MNENNAKKSDMWPVIIGAGAVALLLKALFEDEEDSGKEIKKRIFISFAVGDSKYRDYLVKQAKDERSPFAFVDMSVKQPWEEDVWKHKCRTKIKSCDGMIVLLSKNTWHASGTRWEIKCAKEEGLPVIGMHIKKNNQGATPPELYGKKVITWSWDNLAKVIKKM
ncbi:TIR domain-containing protein [Imperialibacter roseus]|uniref:TIR domain-containing protein n=1 Tax=Imperialibacter roseus TaxID=1324217 RepID=A0ABZ0IV65_9BACT|nr:TIR domain-containing protein [Imperialibacter roseus]WOK08397.1 TIR domain-containing protein [Imperialibacter roseus]